MPKHRHLSEIEEQLSLAARQPVVIQFSPHLIPVNRGILTTLYLDAGKAFRQRGGNGRRCRTRWRSVTRNAYGSEPFVRLLEGKALPDTKNVIGTNVIEIAWRLDPRTGRLIVMSARTTSSKAPAARPCKA